MSTSPNLTDQQNPVANPAAIPADTSQSAPSPVADPNAALAADNSTPTQPVSTPAPAPDQTATVSNAPQTPQSQQTAQQPLWAQSQAAQSAQYANLPAVKHASVIREAAQALAGGAKYQTTIDPQTGVATRTEVPLTKSQIIMGIVATALGGASAGLAQKGPNATGTAAAAGFQQGQDIGQQRQQAQQQEDKQASDDYVRQFQATKANLQMQNLAMQTGKLTQDAHDSLVKSSAGQLAKLQDDSPESIAAQNLSEQDAMDVKKYPMTDYYRIPDGTVARYDANGNQVWTNSAGRIVPANTQGAYPAFDNTYSVVHRDANVAVADANGVLPEVSKAVSWGLLTPSWLKAAPGATLPGAVLASYAHKAQALDLGQHDLTQFASTVNAANPNGPQINAPDLHAAVAADKTLPSAMEKFQPLLNKTGHNYEKAFAELQKTNPAAASSLSNLYGADAMHTFDMHQANLDATAKAQNAIGSTIDSQGKANAVISAAPGTYTPDQVASAKRYNTLTAQQKAAGKSAGKGGTGSGDNEVADLGEGLAKGSLTEDQIPTGKVKSSVQAYLTIHHPNLDQGSVMLDGTQKKMRDLGVNATNNLNLIQSTLARRPDLVGIIQGRLSQGKELSGTDDKDLSTIATAAENYSLAATGAHGIRSVEARVEAKKALLNSWKNGAAAINASIAASKQSLNEFVNLGKPKGLDGSAYVYDKTKTPAGQQTQGQGQHAFSQAAWLKANPQGNVQQAAQAAQKAGYSVVN
jgi:hypothetical protein